MAKGTPVKKIYWKQGNLEIPVHIFREWRASSRVSIGKKAILIRVPQFCRGPLLDTELSWIQDWLQKQFKRKPHLATRFISIQKSYSTGDLIQLFDKSYNILVLGSTLKNPKGVIKEDKFELHIPPGTTHVGIPLLTSRSFAKHYKSHFEKKVAYWNTNFFQKPIKGIRLKYNKSNWGSCSSSGNINLSTRLLFTPEPVQDYVIVHELSHLIEMNHSSKFWDVVSKVMPNYEEYERWLKEHGDKCFF